MDHLVKWSQSIRNSHHPYWLWLSKAMRQGDGDVGFWHETYIVKEGSYESIYVDCPHMGLSRAGWLERAAGANSSARARAGQGEDKEMPSELRADIDTNVRHFAQ